MSELVKTLCFVVVAAVLAAISITVTWVQSSAFAVATRPDAERGQLLFPDFTDFTEVKAMQITDFDEKTATIDTFRVAEVKGRWALPSHENYPADADRQLGNATAALIDLKKMGVVTDDPATHETFGVLDPEKATAGSEGVGKRVQLEDASGSKLLDLIIGKEVPQRPQLRYVRKPQQDRVYEVQLDASTLTTAFEKWIEPDLLKLNAFDLSRIAVDDYSVDVLQGALLRRGEFTVAYNNSPTADKPQWSLVQMTRMENGKGVDVPLGADQELDTQKLNAMRTALDDLKIVAISRKPAGLGQSLRANDALMEDRETIQSLAQKGFYFAQVNNSGSRELLSNEGEVRVGMNNGVQYVLRFGQITQRGQQKEEDDAEGAVAMPAAQGSNRYLFVAVEFNQDLIAKPELKLPQPEDPFTRADREQAAGEGEAAAPAEGDAEKQPPAEADGAMSPEERKRLEAEDQRKLDEYNDKVKQGQEKVAELNDRFADWYYVISEDTYAKIHLHGTDIVKLKTAEPAADLDVQPGAAAPLDPIQEFEQLQRGIE